MKHTIHLLDWKKFILSVLFGLLGLILSKQGMSINFGEVEVNLPWSIIFPILISFAYGSYYGLISGLFGGALFPFYLWTNNGWANLLTSSIFLSYYLLLGSIKYRYNKEAKLEIYKSFIIIFFLYILIISISYKFLFNPLLRLGTPPWNSNHIFFIPDNLLTIFVIKDCVNLILMTLIADTLINLTVIRKMLGLPTFYYQNSNNGIFLNTMFGAMLMWAIYLILDIYVLQSDYSLTNKHLQIALILFLASGSISSNFIINYIEKRKKIEQQLNISEIKFRSLFEKAAIGFAIIDVHSGNYISANTKFCEITGYSNIEILNKKLNSIFNPESISHSEDIQINLRDGRLKEYKTEKKYLRKDNQFIWVSYTLSTIEVNENIQTYLEIIEDITEKKGAELELLKLSMAVNQSPDSIVITDPEGFIEYVNPKFTEITGYQPEEVIGKTPSVLKSNDKSKEKYEDLWRTIKAGKEWRGEFLNKKKNNQLYWESASISPIKDTTGNIRNFIAIKVDITDKKALDIELKKALDKAEESDKIKSVLLLNMNHEFRTPMTGIIGMANILRDSIPDHDKQFMIRGIIDSGKRLMNTLDSVLELAELESSGHFNRNVFTELTEIAEKISLDQKNRFANKGLNFTFSTVPDKLFINSSDRNINQIITHLLDNAYKFTDKGEVKLLIDKAYKDETLYCKISIADTGIGIAREHHSLIFDEFRQVSEGMSRSHEGSGIGLAIIKKIINLLGGHIELQSVLNSGSTFIIYLPAKTSIPKSSAEYQTQLNRVEHTDLLSAYELSEILLVEDNDINTEVTRIFLSDICQVDHASNGDTAIILAQKKKYKLILMDINLGIRMDGIQTAKEIRKINGYEETPIVALTGYARETDKQKFLAEGFTHFLPKPFDREALIYLVTMLITKDRS